MEFSALSSSGLGHGVFSPVTWVRIPVGSPGALSSMVSRACHFPKALSVRALSSMVEQFPFKEAVLGSSPRGLTRVGAQL